jgi:type I restriction enzyme, S subunit
MQESSAKAQRTTFNDQLPVGYKQKEVGVIPVDWEVKSLKDICWVNQGLQIAIENRLQNPSSSSQVYITIQYLNDGKNVEYINNYSQSVCCNINDILMTRTGNTGIVITGVKGVFHNNFFKINYDKRQVVKDFLVYYLKLHKTQKLILDKAGTSTIPDLNHHDFYSIPITLPPTKDEQTAIANALSDADALIQSLDRLITKKRQIKQGAMQTLLNPYDVNGEIKEGWVEKSYGKVFDFLSTAAYSRADLSSSDDYGYVHYGDIHTRWDGFIDFKTQQLPCISTIKAKGYSLLKEGDLIMADASEDYAGIGKSVEVKNIRDRKVISGLHTFMFRDNKGYFVDGYKGYIHSSKVVKDRLDRMATGLKVYGVSKSNLKLIDIPVPPKPEQTRIATILSDIDTEISTLESKLTKHKQIKQGMMQNLLTGRIRLI